MIVFYHPSYLIAWLGSCFQGSTRTVIVTVYALGANMVKTKQDISEQSKAQRNMYVFVRELLLLWRSF